MAAAPGDEAFAASESGPVRTVRAAAQAARARLREAREAKRRALEAARGAVGSPFAEAARARTAREYAESWRRAAGALLSLRAALLAARVARTIEARASGAADLARLEARRRSADDRYCATVRSAAEPPPDPARPLRLVRPVPTDPALLPAYFAPTSKVARRAERWLRLGFQDQFEWRERLRPSAWRALEASLPRRRPTAPPLVVREPTDPEVRRLIALHEAHEREDLAEEEAEAELDESREELSDLDEWLDEYDRGRVGHRRDEDDEFDEPEPVVPSRSQDGWLPVEDEPRAATPRDPPKSFSERLHDATWPLWLTLLLLFSLTATWSCSSALLRMPVDAGAHSAGYDRRAEIPARAEHLEARAAIVERKLGLLREQAATPVPATCSARDRERIVDASEELEEKIRPLEKKVLDLRESAAAARTRRPLPEWYEALADLLTALLPGPIFLAMIREFRRRTAEYDEVSRQRREAAGPAGAAVPDARKG